MNRNRRAPPLDVSHYQSLGLDLNSNDNPAAYEDYRGGSTPVYPYNLHFMT